MAEKCHLPNAPISEALIDIRLVLPSGIDVDKFSKLPPELEKEFPNNEALKRFMGGFQLDQKKFELTSKTIDKGFIGYIHKSKNNDRVVQLRNDGFTYSKLKPYETWDNLKDEAKVFFDFYESIVKLNSVSRVALRYINHLNIPFTSDKFNFDEYLKSAPDIPSELPQTVLSFLSRVVIPDPNSGATAIVNQALESVTDPKVVPVILDIDVFIERDFDLETENIWDIFEGLRNFKNDIFFAYITDKAKELYK